jgi:transposase
MIVIGTDTHKRTHALVAVDEGTGRIRGNREIKADEAGHLAALKWARGLDEVRVWAIEDCRSVSRRLEEALIAAGERVVRVAPHRMGVSRRGEREPGKSDEIDSLAIGGAVVKDGVECFPAAFLDEQAMEIRLIGDHRHDLVVERTRMQNRLRWHLVTLAPELEASLRRGALADARQLDRIDHQLRRIAGGARVRVAREQITQIRSLTRQIDTLRDELAMLITAHRPALLAETGCGPLTAAILIGRTAGAERFATDASFAQQTATAPLKCSSGQRSNTGSTVAAIANSITPCTSSRSPAPATTLQRAPTSPANKPRGRQPRRRCGVSNDTSPDASTTSSRSPPPRNREAPTTIKKNSQEKRY